MESIFSMTSHIDYFLLNETLLNVGAIHSASQVHGFLCGLLSGASDQKPEEAAAPIHTLDSEKWLKALYEFSDLEHVGETFDTATETLLTDLNTQTFSQLCSDKFSFSMLLPEDDASLARRIQEIAAWSQGYLHGIVCSGLDAQTKLSPESAEGLKDLAHIAQLDDGVEESEENEKYIMQTVEYIKIVVLTVFSELTVPTSDDSLPQSGQSLH